MNKVMNVSVVKSEITQSTDTFGIQGEINSRQMRISLDSEWDEYQKRIIFYDCNLRNPVVINLENPQNDGSFLISIPREPLANGEKFTYIIEGFITDGETISKVFLSVSKEVKIRNSPTVTVTSETAEVPATQAMHLQSEIDAAKARVTKNEDNISEIDKRVKTNESNISALQTEKVNISDVIDNVNTNDSKKPLSARQGTLLKSEINENTQAINRHSDNADIHVTDSDKMRWNKKSAVSVSDTGSSLDEVKYITIDGVEKKLAGSVNIEVDDAIDSVSKNPVQNNAVKAALDSKADDDAVVKKTSQQLTESEKQIIRNNIGAAEVGTAGDIAFSDTQTFVEDGITYIGSGEKEDLTITGDALFDGQEYKMDIPQNESAVVTWKGTFDYVYPSSVQTGYGTGRNKCCRIISSTSGYVVSLPKGVSYTEGMDLSDYSKVRIFSLMRDECVDKDGYVHRYPNTNSRGTDRNAVSVIDDAPIVSYYRGMATPTSSPYSFETQDDIVPINLYYRDVANHNENSVYNRNSITKLTGANGNTYFYGAFAAQEYVTAWSDFTHLYPPTKDSVPYFYVSIADSNGNITFLKPVSYNEFMLDREVNVCTMDTSHRFYIKPNPGLKIDIDSNKYYTIDGVSAFKNIYGLIKKTDSPLAKSEEPINNKIHIYPGGTLVFVKDKECATVENPELSVSTFTYSAMSSARTTKIPLNQTFDGNNELLCFDINPAATDGLGTRYTPNGHITPSRTDPLPLPKAMSGNLRLYSANGDLMKSIKITNLYNRANVHDSCNEIGYIRRFSNLVELKSSHYFGYTRFGSSNYARYELHIPIAELDYAPGIVKSSETANIIQTAFEVRSVDDIRAMTSGDYTTNFIGMCYDGTEDFMTILITQVFGSAPSSFFIPGLGKAQLKFAYETAVPYSDNLVDKIYASRGHSYYINFSADEDAVGYSDISIEKPKNISARVDSIEALCENINALNSGIKNIHIEENKIGKGDGVSDDTLAIQNAINNSAKIAGGLSYAKEVVLPAGIYRISSPILMNIENLTLRGEGQVVLWAAEGNYQPIIKMQKHNCKVENITIWLAKTPDDANYEGTAPNRGYLKSYKESDYASSMGDGQYSGIYIDYETYGGFYNFTVKDVIIQGAYRYSTKFCEKSYGIYAPGCDAACYYNNINNVKFFSVMCGLYLASTPTETYISQFDQGENIYNLTDTLSHGGTQAGHSDNCLGCRYGAYITSGYCYTKIHGQPMGEDTMSMYTYVPEGDDFREMPLNDTTAHAEGKQAYAYNSEKHEFEPIEGETCLGFDIEGTEKPLWRRVTDCGVRISGSGNVVEGEIIDCQRCDVAGMFLTENSKCCMYNSYTVARTAGYGNSQVTFNRRIYIPVEKDANGKYVKWTLARFSHTTKNTLDLGQQNVCVNRGFLTPRNAVFGAGTLSALSENGKTEYFPTDPNELRDALAYCYEYGEVHVYKGADEETRTEITSFWEGDPDRNVSIDNINRIFDPDPKLIKSSWGMPITEGITFKEIPSTDNPIVIEITFPGKPGQMLNGITNGIIRFTHYIPRNFKIEAQTAGSEGRWLNVSDVDENHYGEVGFNTYNSTNTTNVIRGFITKIRLTIFEAYKPVLKKSVYVSDSVMAHNYDVGDVYNPNGYVGICRLMVCDYNSGSRSYFTRGGGLIFGDIEPKGVILKDTANEKRYKLAVTNGQLDIQEL